MFDGVLIDFDSENKILHITGTQKIIVKAQAELEAFCDFVQRTMSEGCGGGLGYLIVDMSRIVIDPSLVHSYAEHVSSLMGRCVHDNGIARYGYEITRLTVRQGYRELPGEDPNIFATKAEALAFIMSQIERNRQSSRTPLA